MDKPSTSVSPRTFHRMNTRLIETKQLRTISPIPEGSKSSESSTILLRQSSVASVGRSAYNHGRNIYRPALVIILISLHWLVSIGIFLAGVLLTLSQSTPWEEEEGSGICQVYYVIVYLRIVFWIGSYAQHELVKRVCRDLVNENYNLYRDTSIYRKAPLQIVSLWNTALIAALGPLRYGLLRESETATQRVCKCCFFQANETGLHQISLELVMICFCGLEALVLTCFLLPALTRLLKAMQLQEEDSADRTLSNQEDIPIDQKLRRQAEQMKILRSINGNLRKEAMALGIIDDE